MRQSIKLFLPLVLLSVLAFTQKATGQNPNMVRITTAYSGANPENGFGFVVYEKDNDLYIATARHVVEQDTFEIKHIEIGFYKSDTPGYVRLIRKSDEMDMALLTVKKPKKFKWNYREVMTPIQKGTNVWLIGRDGLWNSTRSGKVTDISETEIIFDLPTAAIGVSGGPLICNNGLAGMIKSSQTALPIGLIRKEVVERLSIKTHDICDTPHFNLGVITTIGGAVTFDQKLQNNIRPSSLFSAGVFFEMALKPKYSIRIDGDFHNIQTKAISLDAVNSETREFKNSIKKIGASFLYFPDKRFGWSNASGIYLHLGYSFLKTDPKLKINDNNWTSLGDLGVAGYKNSNTSHSINFGFGGNTPVWENYMAGFELSLNRTFSKYIHLNPVKDLSENEHNDWLLFINVRFGYVFRSQNQKIKLIR